MKPRLKLNIKKYSGFILSTLLLVAFLAGCDSSVPEESSETSTSEISSSLDASSSADSEPALLGVDPDFTGDIVSIGVYFDPDMDKSTFSSIEAIRIETEQACNQYLASIDKEYRLSFTLIQPEYESFDRYHDYNIMLYMPYFSPDSFVEEHFLDLTQELQTGDLTILYNSRPEVYWASVQQEGKIYNPLTNLVGIIESLWLNWSFLENLGISLQEIEALKGQDLSQWLNLFEKIYVLNDQKPFIQNPLYRNFSYSSFRTPVLSGIAWEAHFQMVAPMIGISNENPEQGAQFVLESDYADQAFSIWKELENKNYIINEEDMRKDEEIKPLVQLHASTSADIILAEDRHGQTRLVCPLQEQLHAFCRSAFDEGMRYSLLVPQDQNNLSLTFQFLNDLASYPELYAKLLNYVGDIADYAPDPNWHFASAEQTTVPTDAGFIYTPSDPSLLQQGVGFEYDKGAYSFPHVLTMDWLHFDEQLEALKVMYHEKGIDEMVAEVNEQLSQFRKQP